MGRKDKAKAIAESMFIEQGMTCKAISELIEVSEKTLSDWRKSGNWDTRRDEALAAPHKIREVILQQLKVVAEGRESQVDADALAKLSKVLYSLGEKLSIQIFFSVFKEFDTWMMDQDPAMALKFTEYHRQFMLHKINIDG